MRIRIIAIIGAVLMTVLLFVGCGRQGIELSEEKRFKLVEEYQNCYVFVDKETGIGYFLHKQYNVALTPLYNEKGEPYRPNGWRDYGS